IENRDIEKGLKEFQKDYVDPFTDKVGKFWDFIIANKENLVLFANQIKEKQLKSVNNSLAEISLYCDARPLYDIKREKILKFTYPILISMKLDQSDSKIISEIEEKDLYKLQQEVNIAISKIAILKSKLGDG
ncbi:MAG: hypothetical protein V2B15_08195, partial [Bacteroidota bacterium]